jgi:phosphoribosylaminoimidazole-succinocarboxamide synthase
MSSVAYTELPLNLWRRGKVRDVYEVDAERLLLVATDRVSAFDVVMRETVPYKGAVLTQISAWWLRQLGDLVPHHMLSADIDEIVAEVPSLASARPLLAGRSMLCRRSDVFPVECVVRGYLAGSAWKEYGHPGRWLANHFRPGSARANACRHRSSALLPRRSRVTTRTSPAPRWRKSLGRRPPQGSRIYPSAFTRSATSAPNRAGSLSRTPSSSLAASAARSHSWMRCSRPIVHASGLSQYQAGRAQPSFDKQPLRDYLDGERRAGRWDGDPPPPRLPREVVAATSTRYLDAFERITGSRLDLESLA